MLRRFPLSALFLLTLLPLTPAIPYAQKAPSPKGETKVILAKILAEMPRLPQDIQEVFLATPRPPYLPEAFASYSDSLIPLPGHSGAASLSPLTAARILSIIEPEEKETLLLAGRENGYMAALLAQHTTGNFFVGEEEAESYQVYQQVFQEQGLTGRFRYRYGPAREVWNDAAPFSLIILTTPQERIDTPLLELMGEEGRIIFPWANEEGLISWLVWSREKENPGIRPLPLWKDEN